jgi:anti-anti-sigma factor
MSPSDAAFAMVTLADDTRAESASGLSIDTRATAARSWLTVSGRITVDSSPLLRRALSRAIAAAPSGGILVDFTAVSYMDTSAVATLFEAAVHAAGRRVSLLARGLRGDARIVAEGAEVDRVFAALGHQVHFA